MASTSRITICDLPNEIMLSIFSFLPVTDLAQCAATCEQWHEIVTGFTHLWKGKIYNSIRSPTVCAETRAVLHALPPLKEVVMEWQNGFDLSIYYPNIMFLSLKYVSVLDDCPRLRCEYLTASLDIARDILSHRSTIDFDRLLHLQILPIWMGLPSLLSRALANLPQLKNLRKLRLSECRFDESDLATAVAGLANLEILELRCCTFIRNLSFLQHCIRIQELYISNSVLPNPMPMVTPASLWMHELRLPSGDDVDSGSAHSFTLTAVSLPAALSTLEDMGLSRSCLDYIGALCNCSHLTHIWCEFARGPSEAELDNVCVHINLTSST